MEREVDFSFPVYLNNGTPIPKPQAQTQTPETRYGAC